MQCSGKRDLLNDLSIDFKQCPTLEIVIFCVCQINIICSFRKTTLQFVSNVCQVDIADLFPNYPQKVAGIRKLAFNPQLDITQFGVDHIWSLHIWGQNDEVFKLINENVKGIKKLTVCQLSYLDNLVCKDDLLELHVEGILSSKLKIDGLKKLKTLEVSNLAQLDNLTGMDALLELSVTSVKGPELKEYDLSNIAKRFKNLQKCDICVNWGYSTST